MLAYRPKSWSNAVTDDIALRAKYADLLTATMTGYNQCLKVTGLKTCKGQTGKTKANWERDILRYKGLISELDIKIQAGTTNQLTTEKLKQEAAKTQTEVAKTQEVLDDTAKTNTTKYIIIALGVVAVIIGGIIAYKKFKNK
jgi:hypothetical protein